MKVLQVINSFAIGGAEKLVLESVPLLQKNGTTVDVLCLSKMETSFSKELQSKMDGQFFGLTTGSIYNPLLIFKIKTFLKKYDIIHFHLFPTLYWVVLAKWIFGINTKLIYTEHSTTNRRRKLLLFRIFDNFIYKRIDRIVTIAKEVDENLRKHLSIDNKKIVIINNGVNIDTFMHASPYKKEDFFSTQDSIILIQVSSFREAKDQRTLILSLNHLPTRVKLLLVGDGPLISDAKLLVKNNNLSERVLFLGNRQDVPRLLNTADIIVLSSFHEGLSLSNIEGMSVRKPFIGSNVPGIREIVKGHGLLFDQGDFKFLAHTILRLIDDELYYSDIASKCFNRAKDFDIKSMIERYLELYNTLMFSKS